MLRPHFLQNLKGASAVAPGCGRGAQGAAAGLGYQRPCIGSMRQGQLRRNRLRSPNTTVALAGQQVYDAAVQHLYSSLDGQEVISAADGRLVALNSLWGAEEVAVVAFGRSLG